MEPNGYLLELFLFTSFPNRVTDAYGGSVEEPCEILFLVVAQVIKRCLSEKKRQPYSFVASNGVFTEMPHYDDIRTPHTLLFATKLNRIGIAYYPSR
jgi:2,4-dienoyl-CoA reductase-like NADH-dependent reductase (Old Yellow Enzyme family)